VKAIEKHESGGVTATGEGVTIVQLVMLAKGLKLQEHGIRLSAKLPAATTIARRMGFRGNREAQLRAVLAKIEELKAATQTTTEEVLAIHDATSL
jgi:hypothetical protein